MTTKAAIIGSGNIGTDLMYKIMNLSKELEVAAMVGIDPDSDGLNRAQQAGVTTTHEGVQGLIKLPDFDDISVIFDATSAKAHKHNASVLEPFNKQLIDLTPAAIGPLVVPVVNMDDCLSEPNVNMVTCGGQATIPMVAAVGAVAPALYAEIVASVSSRSAGPGTRDNIDEFTETTANAIESVGGALHGKAIIILNPADPPLIMRNTVQVVTPRLDDSQRGAVVDSVKSYVNKVAQYVPGYRLKQEVQFIDEGEEVNALIPAHAHHIEYTRSQIFLEVEGASHYLPAYAGNLDIMTSAAMNTAERIVKNQRLVGSTGERK